MDSFAFSSSLVAAGADTEKVSNTTVKIVDIRIFIIVPSHLPEELARLKPVCAWQHEGSLNHYEIKLREADDSEYDFERSLPGAVTLASGNQSSRRLYDPKGNDYETVSPSGI